MSQFEIEEVELTPQPVLVIKFTSTPQTLGDKLGLHFPAIFQYAQAENLTLTGMPFVRYLEMADVFTVEAGMPVAEMGDDAGEGDIYATELAGGSAITTDYYGPYDRLGTAHEALRTWAIDHGYKPGWGGWEIYETDPG